MKKALAKDRSVVGRIPERTAQSTRPFLLTDHRGTTPQQPLPFHRFCRAGTELAYVQRALDAMEAGEEGYFHHLCRQFLEMRVGAGTVLLTASGTQALEVAALLVDIQPGDEVILPSFASASTAHAFVQRGARPVFADVRRDTLNIDELQISSLITRRTRAIVPMHYAGVGCAMDWIQKVAAHHGITVIEDNAHGSFGAFRGKTLGSFGSLAALNFGREGGALLINDPAALERLPRAEAERCQPSEILAAVLYGQLEAGDRLRGQRCATWDFYFSHLKDWAAANGVGMPRIPAECGSSYHLFYLLLPRPEDRPRVVAHLKGAGIPCASDFTPLHLSDIGAKFGGRVGDCPVTEDVSNRLLRLPFYSNLSRAEQTRVVEQISSLALD